MNKDVPLNNQIN